MDQMSRWFCWMGGFWLLVVLHQEGSAHSQLVIKQKSCIIWLSVITFGPPDFSDCSQDGTKHHKYKNRRLCMPKCNFQSDWEIVWPLSGLLWLRNNKRAIRALPPIVQIGHSTNTALSLNAEAFSNDRTSQAVEQEKMTRKFYKNNSCAFLGTGA